MPESAVRDFSLDVVNGLTYLHASSLAMADLCPEKVTKFTFSSLLRTISILS